MKKINGFTLFEMIVVIGLASGFLSLFLVNFSAETNRISRKQNSVMEQQTLEAVQAYIAINKDNSDPKYDYLRNAITYCGCFSIYISELEEEGFLLENTVTDAFKESHPAARMTCTYSTFSFEYDFGWCHTLA